jgi:integrase
MPSAAACGATDAVVARAIAAYAPRSLSEAPAGFAREAVAAAAPATAARAKALLFAASRLACFGQSVGLELSPEVLLQPSVIERFVVGGCRSASPATRRTLRTNLRGLARALERYPEPVPVALARERAKRPYSPAEIDGYLRLAAAQSSERRRMRCQALVSLGAGAGIIAGELRHVRGRDVVVRAGGVLVLVSGRRARSVPVLARHREPLLAAAAFAGENLIVGGGSRCGATSPTSCARLVGRQLATQARARAAALHLAGGVRGADRASGVHAGRRDLLQPAAGGSRRPTSGGLRGEAGGAAGRAA